VKVVKLLNAVQAQTKQAKQNKKEALKTKQGVSAMTDTSVSAVSESFYASFLNIADKAEISNQAQILNQMEEMLRNMRDAQRASRENTNHWRNQRKAMQIAMRIMRGDNVPPRDYRFLAKHNLKMYKMAVSLRRVIEDPKDHDALSRRNDDEDSNSITINGISIPLTTAVPPPSKPPIGGDNGDF
jgi:hypothetical protein